MKSSFVHVFLKMFLCILLFIKLCGFHFTTIRKYMIDAIFFESYSFNFLKIELSPFSFYLNI